MSCEEDGRAECGWGRGRKEENRNTFNYVYFVAANKFASFSIAVLVRDGN
jgi:hypothetical protein